jgi:hypothetical protein
MGMIGEYARLTPDELARAMTDPEWAHETVLEMNQTGSPADPPRRLDVDKAWDAMRFLLARAAFPVEIVLGEEALPGSDDWGYTQPFYLTPDRVRAASAALAETPFSALTDGVRLSDLEDAAVYPSIWDEEDALEYVQHYYDYLRAFFAAAAAEGDAVVAWVS